MKLNDLEKLIKGIQECDLNGGLIGNCPYKAILSFLKLQPEIVRCKDCRKNMICELTIDKPKDWFCADGERKENERKD